MSRKECGNLRILPELEANIAMIKELSGGSSDVLINEFTTGGVKCCLLSCEGMMSTQTAAEMVLAPLTEISEQSGAEELFNYISTHLLLSCDSG